MKPTSPPLLCEEPATFYPNENTHFGGPAQSLLLYLPVMSCIIPDEAEGRCFILMGGDLIEEVHSLSNDAALFRVKGHSLEQLTNHTKRGGTPRLSCKPLSLFKTDGKNRQGGTTGSPGWCAEYISFLSPTDKFRDPRGFQSNVSYFRE